MPNLFSPVTLSSSLFSFWLLYFFSATYSTVLPGLECPYLQLSANILLPSTSSSLSCCLFLAPFPPHLAASSRINHEFRQFPSMLHLVPQFYNVHNPGFTQHFNICFLASWTFTLGVLPKHLSITMNVSLPFDFNNAFCLFQPPVYSTGILKLTEFIYYFYTFAIHIPFLGFFNLPPFLNTFIFYLFWFYFIL